MSGLNPSIENPPGSVLSKFFFNSLDPNLELSIIKTLECVADQNEPTHLQTSIRIYG